jgi:hypothetical protein
VLAALFNEFRSSIKSPDTEEKLDLLLYRPLGFLIAKVAWVFRMTPTMLSLLGLGFGFLAALYFLDTKSNTALAIGSFYFILSGIFDSSDGQLARISNQSTKLGLILDGICDSLVTIAIYLTCSWPFLKMYGPWFILLMIPALHLHSCQCAILDFYHREYLFFGYGKTEGDTYWNPGLTDGKKLIEESKTKKERIMNKLRLTWIEKQQWLTSRTEDERLKMRKKILSLSGHEKDNFMTEYRAHNLWLLPYWRLVGVNAHTALIIFFMFQRRFDIYIVAFDLILLNLIILAVGFFQKRADKRFFKLMKI